MYNKHNKPNVCTIFVAITVAYLSFHLNSTFAYHPDCSHHKPEILYEVLTSFIRKVLVEGMLIVTKSFKKSPMNIYNVEIYLQETKEFFFYLY